MDPKFDACFDELEKIASAKGMMHVPKGRAGRRSISVAKMLKKEKDGTLFKPSTHLSGNVKEAWSSSEVPFSVGPADPAEARGVKRKGEVPSKEDMDSVQRGDMRESATTVTGIGQSFNNIAATGNSSGGT